MKFKQLEDLDNTLTRALGFNEALSEDFRIKSTRLLRVMVGGVGMLLPILLFLFDNCDPFPLESISHYYYTKAGGVFVSTLTLVGIFLIFYIKDFTASTIAGLAIIAVALFPTNGLTDNCCIVLLEDKEWRVNLHYISALFFFVIVTIMVFKFCDQDENEKKYQLSIDYKWVYRLCGTFMCIALLIMGLRFVSKHIEFLETFQQFYDRNNGTFWMEFLALEAFGLAWLVKGYFSLGVSRYHQLKKMK